MGPGPPSSLSASFFSAADRALQAGELARRVFSDAPATLKLSKWAERRLRKLYQESSSSQSSPASSHQDELSIGTELRIMDETRIRILTALTPRTAEVKVKKMQKCFQVPPFNLCAEAPADSLRQQLAQNLVAHERNYKTLVVISDRLDAIMTRIQCVETDVSSTLERMEVLLLEEDQNKDILVHVRQAMLCRMEAIESTLRAEIQETIEPSAPFIQRKRKLREVDDFLDAFLGYLDNN